MRFVWVSAVAMAGCSFQLPLFNCERDDQCNAGAGGRCELATGGFCSYADPNCPGGQRYGDNAGGNSGVCVGQEPGPDGDTRVCYGAADGLVKPCFQPAPTGDLTLTMPIVTNGSMCSTTVMDAPRLCVIAAANITVPAATTIAVTGDRPLVLVATGTITIAGTLDAASHHDTAAPYATTQVGAGADPPGGCSMGFAPTASGGGAGGTFVALAGDGGYGTSGGMGGRAGTAQTVALRGGCRGQDGVDGTPGRGGRGGGALYLIADTITVSSGGQINASGEGGNRGITGNAPGGGGGSGGLIGLDAMTITNNGAVFANGGGGGEGSGAGASGLPGQDPTGIVPANGGLGGSTGGNGGPGGAGGSGGGNAMGSTGQNAPNDGGGGGGGGAGVIKVYRGTLNGDYSPNPTP